MEILIVCEESQRVCIEFRKKGHRAFSCDIIECSGGHPEWHIQEDCLKLINGDTEFCTQDGKRHSKEGRWDMIIGFPPCTYLSAAGAQHLYKNGSLNPERYQKGIKAAEFFMALWRAPRRKIALENPKSLKIFNLPPHTQHIEPWMFGHPVKKHTRLWLKGLDNLNPTNIVEPLFSFQTYPLFRNGGGQNRQRERSKTFPGVAMAMGDQWVDLL